MSSNISQYAHGLYEALETVSPKDYDKVIENFVEILRKSNQLSLFERVITEFENYDKQKKGIKDAKLTTTEPVNLSKKIIDDLNEAVGSKLNIETEIDENIVGGFILRTEDTLIDASLAKKLTELKRNLSN